MKQSVGFRDNNFGHLLKAHFVSNEAVRHGLVTVLGPTNKLLYLLNVCCEIEGCAVLC